MHDVFNNDIHKIEIRTPKSLDMPKNAEESHSFFPHMKMLSSLALMSLLYFAPKMKDIFF